MSISALSTGAYTTTLLTMVDRVKGGGRAPPTLIRLGLWNVGQKMPLLVYLYSLVCGHAKSVC
jgi:hypothetical protein